MKLTTPEQKLIEAAKLDGLVFTWEGSDFYNGAYYSQDGTKRSGRISSLNYSTSYDAIIPLIQKQPPIIIIEIVKSMLNMINHVSETQLNSTELLTLIFGFSPSQLLDALLLAHGFEL